MLELVTLGLKTIIACSNRATEAMHHAFSTGELELNIDGETEPGIKRKEGDGGRG
uniref:Ethanolaminephosphotransferase n=1 Tax=Arundo donax TaxID=35708 RepID=A0A0A9H1E5_ARUDO